MDNVEFIQEVRKEMATYEYIPKELINYFENAVKQNADERLLPALRNWGIRSVLQGINVLFEAACKASSMTFKDFTQSIDFQPTDIVYGRLDAMFAILRTINGLNIWGFSNIRPLRAGRKKTADIYCEYKGVRCAVEVFCSPQKYTRNDLCRYFIGRATEKKEQLRSTAADLGCPKKIFALVVDSLETQAFKVHDNFVQILREIYNNLGWDSTYHFIIITGMQDYFTGISDDAIYPPMDDAPIP